MKITQHLRPDGRTKVMDVTVDPEVELIAQRMMRIGVYFEAEVLTTGQVSLTSEITDLEGDKHNLAIEVVPNDDGVIAALESLVRTTEIEANRFIERALGCVG